MTFEDFLKGFILFRRTFPMLKIPDESLDMWWRLLADVSFEVYKKSLVLMLKQNPVWFPSNNFAGKVLEVVDSVRADMRYKPASKDRQLGDGGKPESMGSLNDEMEKLVAAKRMKGGTNG